MIKEVNRSELKILHQSVNNEITYKLFEWNYCMNQLIRNNTVHLIDNGVLIEVYSCGSSFDDKRKPIEIYTHDT